MACKNCKPSLLNKQTSKLGEPKCDDCDELEIDCEGEFSYTDCVKSNVALYCIETDIGATQTEINEALDEKLCEVRNGTTKVSITEPDTCPGYLEDKIAVGDGLSIETQDLGGGCQRLFISEDCWEWTAVTSGTGDGKFKGKFKNVSTLGSPYQDAEYSNIKECVVKLRGTVYNATYHPVTDNIIYTLPSGRRPSKIRRFSINITTNTANVETAVLEISTNGDISVIVDNNRTGFSVIPLDGIQFEI